MGAYIVLVAGLGVGALIGMQVSLRTAVQFVFIVVLLEGLFLLGSNDSLKETFLLNEVNRFSLSILWVFSFFLGLASVKILWIISKTRDG